MQIRTASREVGIYFKVYSFVERSKKEEFSFLGESSKFDEDFHSNFYVIEYGYGRKRRWDIILIGARCYVRGLVYVESEEVQYRRCLKLKSLEWSIYQYTGDVKCDAA